MAKTIGVLSLKGGVGKTSSVVALGDAISSLGKRVLLVDANFSAPNLGIHFNIIDPEVTLHDVLSKKANITQAIYKIGEKLHLLPSGIFANNQINAMKLKDKLKSLENNYDIILIDSSPALNEETLAAMYASDELLVVTTPDYPTMAATLKAVKMAKERGTPISGLIINKVYGKEFEISIKDIEDTIGVPVVAVIPNDINVLKSVSEFIPSTSFKPNSYGSIEYKKLAATLVGEKYKSNFFGDFSSLFRKVFPERQDVNRELYYKRVFD
ncbi:MAG: AAA family ATPase [Candidatus Pacearchaeota archaeon]